MVDKGNIAIGLGVVAFILIFIGLFSTGWYHVELMSFWGDEDIFYGLTKVVVVTEDGTDTHLFSDEGMKDTEAAAVSGTTYIIVIIALVIAIVQLILSQLAVMGKVNRLIPMLAGIGTGILLLVALFYYSGGMADAIDEDIGDSTGDYVVSGVSFVWGLVLIAAILAFVSAGLIMVKGKAEAASPIPA